MSALLVARLCRAAGLPRPQGILARTLARAPRGRLVRSVVWLARATTASSPADDRLRGVRLVARGWDDVYETTSVPRDAVPADVEHPVPGRALVIRAARIGRGWHKEPLPSLGEVRPSLELGVLWLNRTVGCILHDDCAAIPELGAACLGDTADER